MNVQKHKNKYLALATSLLPPAIIMLTEGRHYQGTILAGIAVALVAVYAYYDDKQKGAPALPEGIDEALIRDLAKWSTDNIEEQVEEHTDNGDKENNNE